jgi:uncharacterized protein YdeI (YjbR/CyaY-like superfamily)
VTARFFATPAAFRRWLEANHASHDELLVGFHKKGSGKRSITWPEAVDEALCFGWIDGVRKSIDEDSYTIRFTPRNERSTWSAVNIAHAAELLEKGRMRPAGIRAFERRSENRSQIYAYEQRDEAVLDRAAEREFRANEAAWTFFQAQPPWYRRTAIYWVMTAKKEDTRRRRLDTLIDDSAHGRRIKQLARPAKGATISRASTGSP